MLQALFYPFLWTLQPLRTSPQTFRELTMPALELVLLLLAVKGVALAARRRAWRPIFGSDAERFIVLLTIVTYLIWVDVFAIYRYLVPLEMLSFVLLGVCVRRLLAPARPWPIAAGLLVAIVVASLVTEQTDNIGRTAWAERDITVLIPASIPSPAAFLMIGTQPGRLRGPVLPERRLLRSDPRQHPADPDSRSPDQEGPARLQHTSTSSGSTRTTTERRRAASPGEASLGDLRLHGEHQRLCRHPDQDRPGRSVACTCARSRGPERKREPVSLRVHGDFNEAVCPHLRVRGPASLASSSAMRRVPGVDDLLLRPTKVSSCATWALRAFSSASRWRT